MDQHQHAQYDNEHDVSPEPEYHDHSGQSWPLDEASADHQHHHAGAGAADDLDGELNDYAYETGYDEDDHDDQHADYEPPSPSYPYPEDQQPPEPDIPAQDVDDQDYENDHHPSRDIRHSEIYGQDAVSGTVPEPDSSIISEYLRSKDPDWDNADQRRTEPKNLLDLPDDVLRLIVKEASQTHPYNRILGMPHDFACLPTDDQFPFPQITHTNDLTSLALTNSTFHNLAIPHIYSRFDIVWPDAHTTTADAKNVDALTYGLSTLCMGNAFARTTRRFRYGYGGDQTPAPLSQFAGNDYAKYTRKFSLGNGPNDWVAEYMINKESGKMLGTLVALAVSKMINLETFIWDMPTGVLSDIFMALASLPDNSENGQCMLERVWIRWHDNHDTGASSSSSSSPGPVTAPTAVVPAGSSLTPVGIMLPASAAHPAPKSPITYSESQVEYPTFSVLPPLKSLTVLDIDELPYLDEMSVLIERSVETLQELRVGISNKAIHHDFVQTWDGPDLQQVDLNARWPGESCIGERRLGGILGVLLGRIYDIRRKSSKAATAKLAPPSAPNSGYPDSQPPMTPASGQPPTSGNSTPAAPAFDNEPSPAKSGLSGSPTPDLSSNSRPVSFAQETPASQGPAIPTERKLDGKLKLTTLELERVPLSMQVCSRAFDWTVLTNLTILDCAQHENLWKLLKKQFEPVQQVSGYGISPTSSKPMPNAPLKYALNLKRIHTDVTSPALIAFIKETLAPNSLETLFLQDRRRPGSTNNSSGSPTVTIEAIFKGAIKRHRSSLKRLLLDSSAKISSSSSGPDSMRWRAWCLTTDILQYITSGRMTSLKELAVSIEHKDWHTFLQRLPNMPQLRSLHIPCLADHIISGLEPKELVMQMTDIITLRPEIELCYVGISSKCFEILETRASDNSGGSSSSAGGSGSNHTHGDMSHPPVVVEDVTDGDDDTEDDGGHDEVESDDDEGTPTSPTDPDETQSENSYDGHESDDDSFVEPVAKTRLRLREILFYDDKVAIFKARHGRL